MKISDIHKEFLNSSGVCTDTRKITKDCLFVALKGPNFNGNEFVQEALDKGAYKAVIDDMQYHRNTGETILYGDSLNLLQKLANYHRHYLQLPVIALTGSNGKTTTKELINAVLSKKFRTTATQGNLNNHIGVPLTLLSMNEHTQMGIVEMGANHKKEIEKLSEIADPDFGYITNFGKAHLEGFGGVEGVIQGKSELYAHLMKTEKLVFVNGNDPKQMELTAAMNRITFGNDQQQVPVTLKDDADFLLLEYKGMDIQSQLRGTYNFHNIAAAIAMGDYFEVPVTDIKAAIEGYRPENMRSQILEKNGHKVFLDAYNANPTSMLAALDSFLKNDSENKTLLLGDMFELGEAAAFEHQNISDYLSSKQIEQAFLVGENFFKTQVDHDAILKFSSFDDLAEYLSKNPLTESNLMVKGSRGMALERILDLL